MGADFERRVRKDIDRRGWNISKYQNNIEFEKDADNQILYWTGKSVPAKASKFRLSSTGFPDFICIKRINRTFYDVIFIECKTNGYLSKIEKVKAKWYIENNYCSSFLIASKEKIKNKIHINYKRLNTKLVDKNQK